MQDAAQLGVAEMHTKRSSSWTQAGETPTTACYPNAQGFMLRGNAEGFGEGS